jgi:hypothetical protein
LASKFAKSANITQNINSIWVPKNAEFDAGDKFIEKFVNTSKGLPEKLYNALLNTVLKDEKPH